MDKPYSKENYYLTEEILNPQQLQFENIRSGDVRKGDVKKGKLIDRTMLDDGFAVILTLKQELLNNGCVDIILRIFPTKEAHLPEGIKLRMFYRDQLAGAVGNRNGDGVSTDMQAKSEDEWIQLHFTGEPGDEFTAEVVKGDISVVENFVI